MKNIVFRGLLLLTLGICMHSAWGQGSTYFSRSSFLVASESVPGVPQSISFLYGPPGGSATYTISNVTFTGRSLLQIVDSSVSPVPVLWNFDGPALTVQFDYGTRAFGAEFSSRVSPWYSSFTATLALDNGQQYNFSAPANPGSQFFGFISPTPVRSLTFSDGGLLPGGLHEELIGDTYMVMEVPEPNGLSLAILGAAFLIWRRPQNLAGASVLASDLLTRSRWSRD